MAKSAIDPSTIIGVIPKSTEPEEYFSGFTNDKYYPIHSYGVNVSVVNDNSKLSTWSVNQLLENFYVMFNSSDLVKHEMYKWLRS